MDQTRRSPGAGTRAPSEVIAATSRQSTHAADVYAVTDEQRSGSSNSGASSSACRAFSTLGSVLPEINSATAAADARLLAWADGYLTGYDRGREEGLAEYDREVVDALTIALGGPDCPDRREAVRRHLHAVDARNRRREADQSGPRPDDFPGVAA